MGDRLTGKYLVGGKLRGASGGETLLNRLTGTDTKTVFQVYKKKIGRLEREKLLLFEKAGASGRPVRPFAHLSEPNGAFQINTCRI